MQAGRGFSFLALCVAMAMYCSATHATTAAFVSSSAPASLPVAWTFIGEQQGSQMGYALAAGDINGDGYADALIGAPLATATTYKEGVVYVFLGGPNGLAANPQQIIGGGQQGARFGAALAFLGDLNGDGFGAVVVGAPEFNAEGRSEAGALFVFYGATTGLKPSPDWVYLGPQAKAQLGYAVAGRGDVNGDGWDDLVAGAPLHSNDQTNEGRAYLFLGSPTGLFTSTVQTLECDQANARFGAAVSLVGDVNGDGYADIAVGAPSYDRTATDEGAVFVYLGAETVLPAAAAWTGYGGQASAWLGSTVVGADLDGDGYAELLVGALRFQRDYVGEGAVFVFAGAVTGLGAMPIWQAYGGRIGAQFGAALSIAGDINGDTFADLAVGAPFYEPPPGEDPQSLEGAVFVYLGTGTGLARTPTWRLDGNKAETEFGAAVAVAARVNNDSFGDILVGAPSFKRETVIRGQAFLFLGAAAEITRTLYLPLVLLVK